MSRTSLERTVTGHGHEAPEGIFTVDDPKLHLLQSKEGARTAESFDSNDEGGYQQPDADPEQCREDGHMGSQEEPVPEDFLSLLSEFESM